MSKVTKAKKAAEANLISRREETAAMRSQANTAKLLADTPTLMRLRELEVLERIASMRWNRAARGISPGAPDPWPRPAANTTAGSPNRVVFRHMHWAKSRASRRCST